MKSLTLTTTHGAWDTIRAIAFMEDVEAAVVCRVLLQEGKYDAVSNSRTPAPPRVTVRVHDETLLALDEKAEELGTKRATLARAILNSAKDTKKLRVALDEERKRIAAQREALRAKAAEARPPKVAHKRVIAHVSDAAMSAVRATGSREGAARDAVKAFLQLDEGAQAEAIAALAPYADRPALLPTRLPCDGTAEAFMACAETHGVKFANIVAAAVAHALKQGTLAAPK